MNEHSKLSSEGCIGHLIIVDAPTQIKVSAWQRNLSCFEGLYANTLALTQLFTLNELLRPTMSI
jgi:hypothetical protein